eukprot:s90_g6.t1
MRICREPHLQRWMIWLRSANMITFVLQRKSQKLCPVDCIGCQSARKASASSCIAGHFADSDTDPDDPNSMLFAI